MTPQSDDIAYIQEELGFIKQINFLDEQLISIDPELLLVLHRFPQTITIGDEIPKRNFKIRWGVIIKKANGITYKIAFDNISLCSNNLSSILYIKEKNKKSSKIKGENDFILLTSIDEFQGTFSKKEVNMDFLPDIESALKRKKKLMPKHMTQMRYNSIEDNSLEMFLLVRIDDIEHITLDDPQILVNAKNTDYKDIINEGSDLKLAEYPKYEFIHKLRRSTWINLNFSTAFTTKRLDKLLEYTAEHYSNLKIQSLDSFYFITEENMICLKRFLENCPSWKILKIRICSQEALLNLLELLAKTVIIDLQIIYLNDKNEVVVDAWENYIKTYFDRTFKIKFESQGDEISSQF